jgi:hypothetical protein
MRFKSFQKVLSNNNAVLKPMKLNDRHALGVIDAFCEEFKAHFMKGILDKMAKLEDG